MIKILMTLFSLILTTSCVTADVIPKEPYIPLVVSDIDSFRLNDQLIRVIRSFPDEYPNVHIERLATPKLALLESLVIDSLPLKDGTTLSFVKDISAVSLDKLLLQENVLSLQFDYYPARGTSFMVNCFITVGVKTFSSLNCSKVE